MARLFIALATLAILVVAPNVLAGPVASSWPGPIVSGFESSSGRPDVSAGPAGVERETPTPVSLGLLLAGLFGLTAAGDPPSSRRRRRESSRA
ncbi:MAG: hypothetical protein JRG86_14335 [Deltaproteobacteria bacterium]|jgi:hypothetical protein|nr:hypothetical protein [Deltaproteobacteria bacterium]MBW2498199.1 hypothetical protein [Deltaproteobacteria bacterium]